MLLTALSFLVGVSILQQLPELVIEHLYLACAVLLLTTVLCIYLKIASGFYRLRQLLQPVIALSAGFIWAFICAEDYLAHRLPESLAGEDIWVEGRISGIPQTLEHVQRFLLRVERFEHAHAVQPELLRVSWYYGPQLKAGERWRLKLRVKPPHGFMNPGGFDYEGWLYQQGIHATAYVRKSDHNSKLSASSTVLNIDHMRQSVSGFILATLKDSEMAGVINALAVGDRSAINKPQWDRLITTGTNHLVAISGLHIGLAAAFGYWLIRRSLPAGLFKHIPAQMFATAVGMFVAFVYALLAGFSIPTQRALIMLLCVAFALLSRRHIRPVDTFAAALLMVLIWDPVSVLAPGFWFSFAAVAAIFYAFSQRFGQARLWQRWVLIQFVITLALFPLSLYMFQQTSLVSPVANLLFVPFASFLIVPLVLLALIVLPVSSVMASGLLSLAAWLLEGFWPFIDWLGSLPLAYWQQPPPTLWAVMLAIVGVGLLLSRYPLKVRLPALVLLLPVLVYFPERPDQGAFRLSMLDVGQGLAAVVQTQNHALVFDTGARFSPRLDAGESVVLPYLRNQGIDDLDKLVISHADNDHIGGAQAVLSVFATVPVLGSELEEIPSENVSACIRGMSWRWDDVDFEFLHPGEQGGLTKRNNLSCVLRVSGKGGSVLLTADIEKKAERELMLSGVHLQSDVLIAAHHGSQTSSGKSFIRAVKPEYVIIPAGYRNRYRHPHPTVLNNYSEEKITSFITGLTGALQVDFIPQRGVVVHPGYRETHRRYWHHRLAP